MSLSRKAVVLLAGVSVALGACSPAASQSPSGGASASATSAASDAPSGSAGASESAGASGSAGASEPASACNITVDGTTLQPLEDGFPDQPITIISIDDPGAPDGIYALTMKAAIEENGIIDQRIIVEDRPDFGTYGTWEGLEYMDND